MMDARRALAAALVALCPATGSAHNGARDEYGCHKDNKAKNYHCHAGPFDGRTFPSKEAMMSTAGQRLEVAPPAQAQPLAELPASAAAASGTHAAQSPAAASGTHAAPSAAASPQPRMPSQEEVARCTRIPLAGTRLACYDKLFPRGAKPTK